MAREVSPTPPGTKLQVDAPPGVSAQPRTSSQLSPFSIQHTLDYQATIPHREKPLQGLLRKVVYGEAHFDILAGDNSLHLGREVGALLQKDIPDNHPPFKNGEIRVLIPPTLAHKDIYIIQSTIHQPHKSFMQLLLMEEAAKGVAVNSITAIVPHLAYSRQDRREQPGAPQSGKLMADIIYRSGSHHKEKRKHEAKLTRDAKLITVDVHSEEPLKTLTEEKNFQWVNLDSSRVLLPAVTQLIQEQGLTVAVAFPDKGALKRYQVYADALGGGIENAAVIQKERAIDKNNVVTIAQDQESLAPKVAGRDVFLFDDIIDTGGSIVQAAVRLKEEGARSVRVVATHGIFSGEALQNLASDAIDSIMITDTISPREDILADPKIQVISVAPLIAEAIRRIENREPLAELVKSASPDFEKSNKAFKTNRNRRKHAAKLRKQRKQDTPV